MLKLCKNEIKPKNLGLKAPENLMKFEIYWNLKPIYIAWRNLNLKHIYII
jgi:hypothetical protein